MRMKRLLALISLSIISISGIYAMNDKQRQDEGTERLWKEYEAAAKLDLPEKQLELLDRIKSEARTKKLPWDFKRASDLYINVASNRNWKLRESLQEARKKEVEEFGSAVLSYSYCKNDSDAVMLLIKERRSELESARNAGFYSNDHFLSAPKYGSLLSEKLIRNDYEYLICLVWKPELVAFFHYSGAPGWPRRIWEGTMRKSAESCWTEYWADATPMPH